MATLDIPNGAFLKLEWSSTTGTWSNVLGLVGAPQLPTIDQAFADAMHTVVSSALSGSGMVPLLANTVVFERVKVRRLDIANQAEFASNGTPVSGAGTGDMLPLSLAVCVTLRTALAGKSFRGRTYLSGWDETQNTATGRTNAAANTAAKQFIDNIFVNSFAQGVSIAVLSRNSPAVTIPAKTIPARAGQANPITASLVRDTKWESQRRRTGRS